MANGTTVTSQQAAASLTNVVTAAAAAPAGSSQAQAITGATSAANTVVQQNPLADIGTLGLTLAAVFAPLFLTGGALGTAAKVATGVAEVEQVNPNAFSELAQDIANVFGFIHNQPAPNPPTA